MLFDGLLLLGFVGAVAWVEGGMAREREAAGLPPVAWWAVLFGTIPQPVPVPVVLRQGLPITFRVVGR